MGNGSGAGSSRLSGGRCGAAAHPRPTICVLCGWPMDGTVNILEVYIGSLAVYRACAGGCPPSDVNRCSAIDRQRYIDRPHAVARRVRRQIAKLHGRSPTDFGRLGDLESRRSVLLGLVGPQHVDVTPSSVAGVSAGEVIKRIRDQTRRPAGPEIT